MNSPVPIELLWQAWPDGYLAMRGVSTVGGYLYWGNGYYVTDAGVQGTPGHAKALFWGVCDPKYCKPLQNGFLLPCVDPNNSATWACLKRDLAQAMFGTSGSDAEITWTRPQGFWVLRVERDRGRVYSVGRDGRVVGNYSECSFGDIQDEDPALALVKARIELRKELSR